MTDAPTATIIWASGIEAYAEDERGNLYYFTFGSDIGNEVGEEVALFDVDEGEEDESLVFPSEDVSLDTA